MPEYKLTDEQINKIISLYNEGVSCLKLAKRFGFSSSVIMKHLKRKNIEIRDRSFYSKLLSPEQEAEVINIYTTQNLNSIEIAKVFNVSKSNILLVLKKYNIERRNARFYNDKLTFEQETEIVNLYRQGIPVTEIADKFGTDKTKVSYILKTKTNGQVFNSDLFTRLTSEKEKQIIDLYNKGLNAVEISECVKVSARIVRRYLAKEGLLLEDKKFVSKINPDDIPEIIRLYLEGMPSTKICKKYGVGETPILNILRKNNIKIKKLKNYITKVDKALEQEIIILYQQGRVI